MKNIFVALFLLILANSLSAQQEPMFSQYMLNPFLLNPAVAGTDKDIPIRINARQQWMGITDAPSTQILSAHSEFGRSGKTSVGGMLMHDQFGPLSKMGIKGCFAYKIALGTDLNLSFGMAMSVYQLSLNQSDLNIIDQSDQAITGTTESVIIPDADFGMYLYQPKWFVGFSSTQLIQYPISFSSVNDLRRQVPHFYLTGGYRFTVSEKLDIEPSLLVKKTGPTPFQLDINARAIFQKDYWLGLSYRTEDALIVMIGLDFKQYSLGYAYDYTLSGLNPFNSGSHEIMLGIDLKRNPRVSVPQL